ncbi:MAG: N-acetylmuramoyl-L-alanine amidase, partial [Acidimicrobiia bacterium]
MNAPRPRQGAPLWRAMALCGLLALAASGCTGASAIDERGGGGATAEPIAPLPSVTVADAGPTATTMAPEPTGPPRPVADVPEPTPPAPRPGTEPGFSGRGTVVVARGGAEVRLDRSGEPVATIREGVVLAGLGQSADGEWTRVLTTCDEEMWLPTARVHATPPAPPARIGAGFDFGDAVIVVDAGHGGPANTGAQSAGGLVEKENNLVIAARLRDLLERPSTIDWETGAIHDGTAVPAAGRVIMTRVGDGPAGDYEAGLTFRATVANTAGAHALVSIHTNAGWDRDTAIPGSDVYYQSQQAVTKDSRRLAKLMVEELRRGLAPFEADWVGTTQMGAKSRLSPRTGGQYYGILDDAAVPAVIAEGAYIANPSEGALLETPEFQQAYADAMYRALVRFLTTDDAGEA